MRKFDLARAALLVPFLCAGACAQSPANSDRADLSQPEVGSDVRESILTAQIDDESSASSQNSLFVDQIGEIDATEYAFPEVEGDDPCAKPGDDLPEQCNGTSRIGQGQSHLAKGGSNNALAELQSITPTVIDPTTFDADRTADEIGRGSGRLQSQAGMALGADLLAPPPPPKPEPDPNRPFGPDGVPLEHLPLPHRQ